MWLSILFMVICCLCFIKYHWDRRKFYRLSWKLPGPPALPIIGNAYMLRDSSKIIESITKICKIYKTPARFWLGPRFTLFFDRPEEIDIVLNSKESIDRGYINNIVTKCIGGEGLFSSGGETWKTHRKLLAPTVQHHRIVNSFYPRFNRNLKILIGKLQAELDNGEIDIYPYIEACTLDFVCETTFGLQMNIQDRENRSFLKAANNIMYITGILMFQPWYMIDSIFKFSKYYRLLCESIKETDSFIMTLLETKLQDYKSESAADSNKSDDGERKSKHIFIDQCLKLMMDSNLLTKNDVFYESITILAGGFETTATCVSNIILTLAMFPEHQQKVYEEIKSIFPDENSPVTADDIAKLEFTERFIKETMRLIPVVPFLVRYARDDMKIGTLDVPSGTDLGISVYHLHRNKDIWGPEADQFNPDNFLPENHSKRHPYAYIPFGGGPRICIGIKYGTLAIRVFICWLVRHYRFTSKLKLEDLQFRMNITMKIENKHLVYVQKRLNYN